MTSTERELTALKSDWRDSGLTWDDFGACTQKHLDDLNDLWFPYNVVNRIKVQSIWYRHHNRDQGNHPSVLISGCVGQPFLIYGMDRSFSVKSCDGCTGCHNSFF